MFPKEFADDFAKMGIDVHDPRFGAWWGNKTHNRAAKAYNDAWAEWFADSRIRHTAGLLKNLMVRRPEWLGWSF